MYSKTIKDQALLLRREGKSYFEINSLLGIPKSTLAGWLKGVPFSESVKNNQLARVKQIWGKNISDYNLKRHQEYLEELEGKFHLYASEIPPLDKTSLFFLFMGLFWGEGCRKDKSTVRVVNSDPKVIQATQYFLVNNCGVSLEQHHCRVHIHQNANAQQALDFWAEATGIAKQKIRIQTVISSASKNKKPVNTLPFGTAHIFVYNAKLKQQIDGWLMGIKNQVNLPG
jgi:hypothetical protein